MKVTKKKLDLAVAEKIISREQSDALFDFWVDIRSTKSGDYAFCFICLESWRSGEL